MWKIFIKTMKIMGKRCVIYLLGIFFMSTGWAMFSVMASLLMKNVVDSAQTGDSRKMIYTIIANVIGGVAALLVYRAAAIAYNVEAKRAFSKVIKVMFHHEIRLPYSYYEEHHSGDFMSKLSYDMEKMGSIYGSRFRRTVAPLLQVLVYVIPMLLLSWQITLCLIVVNLVMLFINGALINPMKNVSAVLSKTNGQMTEKLSNLLQGMEQARMYSSGRNTVEEFHVQNQKYAKESNRKILYTACLESCANGFDLLCALTFLMVGIFFVQRGYTTLGSLAAIYSLYGNFSNQFLQLGRYLPELVGCLTNARNIFEFMEIPEEPENWYHTGSTPFSGNRKETAQGKKQLEKEQSGKENTFIQMEDVSFCYREDKPLLENYSMEVKEGESVALTGHSGCGKSTISKLLLGLYPVKRGDIRCDGKSIYDISNEELRRQIAYVPQEPYLFNMSVKENIRIGRADATDEEIIEAAKKANAHNFIMELEKGYDTVAGERGNCLSGGQRQRIAIARAILKDASILLMDEATSALDNESEQLVNDSVKSLQHRKTIVMIAHRPSTIALADRVYEMK